MALAFEESVNNSWITKACKIMAYLRIIFLRAQNRWKSTPCSFKIDFMSLNDSKRIQLQFATNRIKIGPLEPEIQPAKGARRHYTRPRTSRDVIGLSQVLISLVTLYNCLLTVEDYTKDTQEISGTQSPYRRCERRIFVICSTPWRSMAVLLPSLL